MRDRRYFAKLTERFGFLPDSLEPTAPGGIWFHAVSVGEVLSAAELVKRIRAERPDAPVFVSTSTLAGRALAEKKFANVFYAPLDYRWMVRRVLRKLRPSAVVILETEIWPNLFRESKRAGAALAMVNARISDRALPRYRRFRFFFREALRWPDAILAQSDQDRRRFEQLGAARVVVAGNLKYDLTPPGGIAPEIARFLSRTGAQQIFIAASTMTDGVIDEDDMVIGSLPRRAGVLTILAPRKPERFDLAAEKLERANIPFVRRSRGLDAVNLTLPGVLLLDTIGELAALFQAADAVFMGGTLADRGGHNVLEPALFGKPVMAGPHMENFAEIAREFEAAGALYRIASVAELPAAILKLLDHPADIGTRARDIAVSKRGAGDRMIAEIFRLSDDSIPDPSRTLPARLLLTPCSWLWRAGNRVKASRTPRALSTPVISIGGLTMGGAGKSPMVAHLAARLRESGRDPAILTRGYKRASRDPLIVPRGESASASAAGDEASIFIGQGNAHVGIGADRYAVGREMEETLAPGLFLLDDGFQHRRLARTRDIVLIDAADPLAGGVFPLGRLREPLDGLARADAIVLTRCEPGRFYPAVERLLARFKVPIFRSRVIPLEWISLTGDRAAAGSFHPARPGAFCGLGDPSAFWRTLERLGIQLEFRREFMDHHKYAGGELEQLARGATVLLTTEKDAINLPAGAAARIAPCELYYLKIGIEIENEAALLRLIES